MTRLLGVQSSALPGALALLAVAASCGGDKRAELTVIVEEAAPLPLALERLRAEQWALDDDGGERLVATRSSDALYRSSALLPWDATFARGDAEPATRLYRFRAAGLREGNDYVRASAALAIPDGSETTLTLRLEPDCVLLRCPVGRTCAEARCVDEREAACPALEGDVAACTETRDGGARD